MTYREITQLTTTLTLVRVQNIVVVNEKKMIYDAFVAEIWIW